ncbi:WD40 repeat domain-containing protein [Comamonas sp. NLF-1-9]|uniref:WD40 repeat domain-containing protein n=1 Tax=Comamonas sp. NLF-1-9 TaxID=2853163 RepID=UPI001C43E82F|nr:hypothetical protein [Comamonas sp. NLF-1-9]QXL84386.1 hypothetical protein KUD94_14405 [Comamonas sp. NLF-1-9]
MAKKPSPWRLKPPAFRLGSGSFPRFVDAHTLVQLGTRGVEVWDVQEGRRRLTAPRVVNPASLAVSASQRWAATSNGYSQAVVADLHSGASLCSIALEPRAWMEKLAVSPTGDRLLALGQYASLRVFNPATGACERVEKFGDERWFAACLSVHAPSGRVLIGFNEWHHSADDVPPTCTSHLLQWQWPLVPGAARLLESRTRPLQQAWHCPDGERLLVLSETWPGTGPLELRLLDTDGGVLRQAQLQQSPLVWQQSQHASDVVWSADGAELALVLSWGEIVFLDAHTLQVKQRAYGDNLRGLAWAPGGDLLAITGAKGLVLPREEVASWSTAEGQPAAELHSATMTAVARLPQVRKHHAPRAAVFFCPDRIVVQAERLFALMRYLPQPDVVVLAPDASAQDLGRAVRQALARFDKSGFIPDLPAGLDTDPERWQALGMDAADMPRVRVFGRAHEFSEALPEATRYFTLSLHDGTLDLWPGCVLGGGRFAEQEWPHLPLPADIGDAALGQALHHCALQPEKIGVRQLPAWRQWQGATA